MDALFLTHLITRMLYSNPEIYMKFNGCGNLFCTDTRNIVKGGIFFCLKGSNFNGNEFAAKALEQGAVWVVCDEPQYATDARILLVKNVLETLQGISHIHRKNIKAKILGIGGSNGKTTTKELCNLVLGATLKVRATQGNFNNHIGVPLTLLSFDDDMELGIIELGTNHPGEMELLCTLTEADFGIVTNIGKEHLDGFGDIEAVAKEESYLLHQLIKNGGTVLLNLDDPWLNSMSKRIDKKITYAIDNRDANLLVTVITSMPGLVFDLEYQKEKLGRFTAIIGGRHNLYNILAAIAAGIYLGLNAGDCALLACSYRPSNNRSEWVKKAEKQVLLDAYNANPSSMEAILKEFSTIPSTRCVLLGDMLELGKYSPEEHAAIAQLATTLEFDELYFVGDEFSKYYPQGKVFEKVEDLNEYLRANHIKSEYILIKGSRGIKMEKALEAI